MHRVTALFEGRKSETPTAATRPRAVDENDVLGVGHETKDDSQCARQCPISVKLFWWTRGWRRVETGGEGIEHREVAEAANTHPSGVVVATASKIRPKVTS